MNSGSSNQPPLRVRPVPGRFGWPPVASWVAGVVMLVGLWQVIARWPDPLLVNGVIVFGGVLVIFTVAGEWRRRTYFALTAGRVTYTDLFSTRELEVYGELGSARVVHVPLRPSGRATVQLWVGPDGQTKVRLTPNWWEPDALEALRDATGVPLEVVAEPISAKEMRRRYPRSISWWQSRPVISVALLLAAAVAYGRLG